MAGPWEKYGGEADGPWAKYAAPVEQEKPIAPTQIATSESPAIGRRNPVALTRQNAENLGTMAGNTPKSMGNFLGGIAETVLHPIDTAVGLADTVTGAVKNAMPGPVSRFIDKYEIDPNANARAVNTANAVGQFYKDRYGSFDKLGASIVNDPVSVAADASTLLGLGASLTGGKVSQALGTASKYTNPLNAVTPIVGGVANAGVTAGQHALGMTTGVGAENIGQAFKAGLNNKTAFYENLNGKVPVNDVLETAKQNIANMGVAKSNEYRNGMLDISKDKTQLNFDGIDKSLRDAVGKVTYKGEIKNAKGAEVLQKIQAEIAHWKSLDPKEFHTPEGLDALKQKIGGLVESLPFEDKTARLVGNGVYHAIKQEITAQAPKYAEVMEKYHTASDQLSEIERALSLGDRASKDTAMRKLQSLSRNNVNTNYGNRLNLAQQLEAGGGNEILPAIAGQAMNSWEPRSLVGKAGAFGTTAAAMSNPAIAAFLPLQSPRAVGGTLYGAGKLTDLIRQRSPNMSSAEVNQLLMLLGQAGAVSQSGQNQVGQ